MSTSKNIAFTQADKHILFDLIKKYKHVVENKKTDSVSNNDKKATWKVIALEFNARNVTTKRDDGQLKRCWEKTKTTARKHRQTERLHAMATGGGKAFVSPPQMEEISTVVSSIQPYFDFEVVSEWDSNAIHLLDARADSSAAAVSAEVAELDEVADAPDSPSPIHGATMPASSQNLNNTDGIFPAKLPVSKKGSFSVKSTQMVEAEVKKRIEQIDEEIRMLRESHAAKLKQNAELHAAVMRQNAEIHAVKLAREQFLLRQLQTHECKNTENDL
ncbi:myb/SANT-like DNA-binding domain-containing protein 3 [Bacillus rossius redtenbacheri]|uniref:myb/SANT-like DNA-binding domain-containing protein 3 n=1 Tax=Bacillus rossius redtenbacheri TaxID=93214 RepID=UPI002FDCEC1E